MGEKFSEGFRVAALKPNDNFHNESKLHKIEYLQKPKKLYGNIVLIRSYYR